MSVHSTAALNIKRESVEDGSITEAYLRKIRKRLGGDNPSAEAAPAIRHIDELLRLVPVPAK